MPKSKQHTNRKPTPKRSTRSTPPVTEDDTRRSPSVLATSLAEHAKNLLVWKLVRVRFQNEMETVLLEEQALHHQLFQMADDFLFNTIPLDEENLMEHNRYFSEKNTEIRRRFESARKIVDGVVKNIPM